MDIFLLVNIFVMQVIILYWCITCLSETRKNRNAIHAINGHYLKVNKRIDL